VVIVVAMKKGGIAAPILPMTETVNPDQGKAKSGR
jgi:hypothetical protein